MDVDRRTFMELAAGLLAVGASSGCASVLVTRVVPVGGAVRLPLRNYTQLALPGGYLKIQPEGYPTAIYVMAMEANAYVALSPICTHLGCTVNIEASRLVCPCHGSTYDRAGRVLRGPAEQSLRQFRTELSREGELVIHLEGSA